MSALVGLLVGSVWAGPVEDVAGTGWVIEDPPAWTRAERDALVAVGAALPEALRRDEVRLRRAASPELPQDLTELHSVVIPHRRGRVLELAIDGLAPALRAWAEAHEPELDVEATAAALLGRQLAHGLAHRADAAHGWSREADWVRVSGWGRVLPQGHSSEQDARPFATVHGQDSLVEDLATSVERFVRPERLPGDVAYEPGCRAPSKWAMLEVHLGPPNPRPVCAPLEVVGLDPEKVEHIEVVFIKASLGHISSIFGHTAIALQYRENELGIHERVAYSMAARTGEAAGLMYTLRGLTGGWPGVVIDEPFRRLSLRYSTVENRDLHRYRFLVTDAQERTILARLDELRQSYRRAYRFFTRNCLQLPKELAEAVLADGLGLPPTFGPDAMLARLDRLGMIERLPMLHIDELSLGRQAFAATRLRRGVAVELRAAVSQSEVAVALDRLRRPLPAGRVAGYQALTRAASKVHPAVLPQLDRFLALSDPIERMRARKVTKGKYGERRAAVVDALRAAKSRVRSLARSRGADLTSVDPQGELLEALRDPPPRGSMHTSLRSFGASALGRSGPDGLTPWVHLMTQWYASRMGTARRYHLAPGFQATAAKIDLQVRAEAPIAVRSQLKLFELSRMGREAVAGNTGWTLKFVDLDYLRGKRGGFDGSWLTGQFVFELWQHDGHRHTLQLLAGAAFRTVVDKAGALGLPTGTGLGLPVGAKLCLGSPRQALTELCLDGSWQTVVTPSGVWHHREAEGRASLRLGEVAGVDVALAARYRARLVGAWRATGVLTQEASLGLRFEPY